MSEKQNPKQYDLEERTYMFAKNIRSFIKQTKKTFVNLEDLKQVLRSSGPIAANYIEANEALSKKDFLMRIKICRKESKETALWLRLLIEENNDKIALSTLLKEANELMKIFGLILTKSI